MKTIASFAAEYRPASEKRFAPIWTEYDCTATTRQSARLVLWRSGET
jgi:hypothetical protein